MSAALSATIESLHITAARKLQELIEKETDSKLLARLIATAFRVKGPGPKPTRTSETTLSTHRGQSAPQPSETENTETLAEHTDDEYGDLVTLNGNDAAALMNARREALIAQRSNLLIGTTNSS